MQNKIQLGIFIVFCINAVLTARYALKFAISRKGKLKGSILEMIMSISSFIWSFGMGLMSIQNNFDIAYTYRCIGILGTFGFMMAVQTMMCSMSDLPKKLQYILDGISYLGIVIYFLYIQPGQTIFITNAIGTTFYFKPGIVNIIYAAYFVIVSTNILLVTIQVTKHHARKQIRAAGRKFILVESLVFVGAIFDMFLPTFQYAAFPGSAITHFWGVAIVWYSLKKLRSSDITIRNMSEYIYYSLETPVLVLGVDRTLKIANDAASTFLCISKESEEIQSVTLESLFSTTQQMFGFEGNSTIVNASCMTNGKSCALAISKIHDSYGDLIGYIILLTDLTEHEYVIKQLEQAKNAADSANMSKSLFLANMSHEMRTPMNAILGFSQVALMENLDDHTKEYFTFIKDAGETLLSVINQVLDISKIELGKQELVSANYESARILKDIEIITSVQAKKKNLQFIMEISHDFPNTLCGDRDKLRQILINLLGNSVKFTKTGYVKLTASVESFANDEAELKFTVSDSGIGIEEKNLSAIFERFKRVDEKLNSEVEGTGLGLSITKGLVDLMGGTISVQSIYGLGTSFTVCVKQKVVDASPIHAATEEKSADMKTKSDQNNHGIGRALIVDDNPANLTIASMFLEKYGIPHDKAKNGFEAIELCKTNTYDMIFLDQMMPGIDGTETMKRIRLLPNYLPPSPSRIVALTAIVSEQSEKEFLDKGFDLYLAKPFKVDEFEKIIGL